MMRRLLFIIFALTAILATACGTIATPEPSSVQLTESAVLESEAHNEEVADETVDAEATEETVDAEVTEETGGTEIASIPTETELPETTPTFTLEPPTATSLPSTEVPEVTSASTETEVPLATPTFTLEPPTATPLPPSEVPTEEDSADETASTEVATETQAPVATATEIVATVAATEAPTTEASTDEERATRLTRLIRQNGDPANGEILFNEYNAVVGFQCSTCHSILPGADGLGPTQWELYLRAGDRVEGFSAEDYVYNSIIHPNDYIVEGFPEDLMPDDYEQIFTGQELYDLVMYLLSIGNE